jgi:hypothetical protein
MVDLTDTPAAMIARLDDALTRRGEDVTVRRYTAATGNPRPKTDIATRASVRAVRPEQLVGNIDQTASNAALSPTGLSALLPLRKGDKVVVDGRERNIEFVKPIRVGGTLVRIDLVVTG